MVCTVVFPVLAPRPICRRVRVIKTHDPSSSFWGHIKLIVPPKHYNKKQATTSNHDDRRILLQTCLGVVYGMQSMQTWRPDYFHLHQRPLYVYARKSTCSSLAEIKIVSNTIPCVCRARKNDRRKNIAPPTAVDTIDNPQTALESYGHRDLSWCRASCRLLSGSILA